MRVVTVEDNPATRLFVRLTLEAEGHEVAEAVTAASAVEVVERFSPDIVVLDLLLSDGDGLELAAKLRRGSQSEHLKIIAFTGAIPEDETRALRSGLLDDLLIKPAEPLDLVRAVTRHAISAVEAAFAGQRVVGVGADAGEGLRIRLIALGFDMTWIAPPRDGLTAIRDARPALVVAMTIGSNGFSGFDVCAAVRRDPVLGNVPLILTSPFPLGDEDRTAAKRVGANAIVNSDCALPELTSLVRDAMAAPIQPCLADAHSEYVSFLERSLRQSREGSPDGTFAARIRLAHFDLVEHLAHEFMSTEDVDAALVRLIAELVHVLGASRGIVYVADRDGTPTARADIGFPGALLTEALGHQHLLERVWHQKTACVLGPADGSSAAILAANHARSIAAAPILLGDDRLGGIIVASQRTDLHSWTPLLDGIATHVALALSVARTMARASDAEGVMQRRAQHDPLTGLPNKVLVLERLATATLARSPVAVMLVGINRFRYVNASFGHRHADLVLQDLASRLSSRVDAHITVGRADGDRFLVLAPAVATHQQATELASRLCSWLREPLHCDGIEHRLDAAAGIVLFPEHGMDPVTLLWQADTAMRTAKEQAVSHSIFDPASDPDASQRRVIDHALRLALDEPPGGLELHYQPVVALRKRGVVAAEALLRLHSPALGAVAPPRIISVAEESGLMGALGSWVLDAACAQINLWRTSGRPSPPVAVNVAAQQLLDPGFADAVDAALRRWNLPGHALRLEITETAAMQDVDRCAALLCGVRALGVAVVLDDFGTGFSSLAYLRRLPLDAVKIDASFIRELPNDPSNQAVVRSIVTLAHRLDITTIAEGVETEAQLDHLVRSECDHAQGWLFSPALPAEEFRRSPFGMLPPLASAGPSRQ